MSVFAVFAVSLMFIVLKLLCSTALDELKPKFHAVWAWHLCGHVAIRGRALRARIRSVSEVTAGRSLFSSSRIRNALGAGKGSVNKLGAFLEIRSY